MKPKARSKSAPRIYTVEEESCSVVIVVTSPVVSEAKNVYA